MEKTIPIIMVFANGTVHQVNQNYVKNMLEKDKGYYIIKMGSRAYPTFVKYDIEKKNKTLIGRSYEDLVAFIVKAGEDKQVAVAYLDRAMASTVCGFVKKERQKETKSENEKEIQEETKLYNTNNLIIAKILPNSGVNAYRIYEKKEKNGSIIYEDIFGGQIIPDTLDIQLADRKKFNRVFPNAKKSQLLPKNILEKALEFLNYTKENKNIKR